MTRAPEQTWAEPSPEDAAFYDEAVPELETPTSHLTIPCVHCGERIRRFGGPSRSGFWFHDAGEEACERRG